MTLTSGFFNSVADDREYDALQMGQMFEGLIWDGVYEGLGDHLDTVEDSGMDVLVGSGRAWFKNTWTYNDADLGVTVPTAHALLNRIDVIYLEVNFGVGVRANTIDIVSGTPASSPVAPTLTQSGDVWQYPLAEIYVGAAVTSISDSNITIKVGTVDCPFITGIISGNIIDHDHTSGLGGVVHLDGLPTIVESKLGSASVTEPKLGTSSVTEDKIAEDAVTEDKIASQAVTTGKIAAFNIIENRIADGAVTAVKQENRNRLIWTPVQAMRGNGITWENTDLGWLPEFPNSAATEMTGSILIPRDYYTNPSFTLWGMSPIVDLAVYWRLYYKVLTWNEASNGSWSLLTKEQYSETDQIVIYNFGAPSGVAQNDYIQFRLYRDGAGDPHTGDVYPIGLQFQYLADS